jgi:type II secretory pathway component HofQ
VIALLIAAALASGGQAPSPVHRDADRRARLSSTQNEKTVTLDVKDEDVRVILRSMQKQCEIRNLVIDPKVQGSGTFVFHALPCRTAFETVTSTLSLKLDTYENDVVVVAPR